MTDLLIHSMSEFAERIPGPAPMARTRNRLRNYLAVIDAQDRVAA